MSSQLPFRPASTKPFPFLDLPGEIRNKVYQIILGAAEFPTTEHQEFHKVPTEIVRLRHGIETQILRTCRSVYTEAKYVMRRTNLLVKVILKVPFDEVSLLVITKKIPILQLKKKVAKTFKDFVLSHEFRPPAAIQEKPYVFVMLYRDLHRFCAALAEYRWRIARHDELISHIVTLVDPYEDEALSILPPFYTRKLQETLIAPYRAVLRGFPRFTIQGAIPKDLRVAAVSEITRPIGVDQDTFLRGLEELKAKGNEYFRNGNTQMASDNWCKALLQMHRVLNSQPGERMMEVGKEVFVNQLAALHFDLCSNCAQNYLKPMRENTRNPELVRQLAEGLFQQLENARQVSWKYPSASWEPSPQQVAKLFYREAVACRLIGTLSFLAQGETAIGAAIRTMPGDAELENEKQRILQWRRRITG